MAYSGCQFLHLPHHDPIPEKLVLADPDAEPIPPSPKHPPRHDMPPGIEERLAAIQADIGALWMTGDQRWEMQQYVFTALAQRFGFEYPPTRGPSGASSSRAPHAADDEDD